MKRRGRLSSARATGWVEEYKGRNIIAGYSKWFAVDLLCALVELRLLGVKIDQGREEQIKASIKARAAQRARRKKLREQAQIGEVHAVPDDFLFVADCAGDYLPDWVCADELQEAPRCDEEEEVIEPPVSLATAELGSSESAHHPSGRRHPIRPSASLKGECLSHLGLDDIRAAGQLSGRRPIVSEGGCRLDASSAIHCPEEMVRTPTSNQMVGLAVRAPAALLLDQRDKPSRQSAVNTVAVPHIADAINNTGTVAD